MKIFTFTKLGRTLLLSAVLAVGSLCVSGCGGGNGADSGGGTESLACVDGEAWVKCDIEAEGEFCIGYVFKSNGELIFVERESDGVWYRYTDGGFKWRIDENTLIMYDDDTEGVVNYNLTRNVLTLTFDGQSQAYTKKNGVHPVLLKSRTGANLSKFILNLKK